LLGLGRVQAGSRAPLVAQFHQAQVIGGDVAGLAADLQFQVLFQELEVGAGHLGHQRNHHAAPPLLGSQVLGPRGFVEPPQASPQIDFPGKRRADLGVAGAQFGARRIRERSVGGAARGGELPLQVEKRE
jgi:hypothetical protein